MIEFVELAAAREATGTRIVVPGIVPSPWSEATKGLFRIAGLPVIAVRSIPGANKDIVEWTGIDNVPVVFHAREPARTCWSQIVGLVARLAPGRVLPTDPAARADVMGLLELIAGEDGVGWNGRIAMIHAGLISDGARGFAPRVAGYLAKRYGYTSAHAEGLRARVANQLAVLGARLASQRSRGHEYFGGERPDAVDVYVATFLTPLTLLTEADCPRLLPPVRQGFAAAAEELAEVVPGELLALRTRMFERHLAWPIEL